MLDFSRCRNVWVPDDSEAGGFWSPPPPHVRYGVEQIIANPYFLLADDMGGMKTAQTIIAAQMLHEMGLIDRVIVVAPASVRPKVWYDEDLGQLREQLWDDKRHLVSEYHRKIKQWRHGPASAPELRWIVTNYEYIRNVEHLLPLLAYCGPGTMLVLDESSAVKGWKSKQTDACMLLRWQGKRNRKGELRPILGVPRCGRILELNGTPVADNPGDLFSQGNLLHQSILDCPYVTHFEARYAIKTTVRRGSGAVMLNPRTGKPLEVVAGWTNTEDLQRRFAPYVLRREAKDLGIDFALPPVGLEVVLTKQTWKHYKAMRDELVIWLGSKVATSATAAVKSIRLAQITSGFVGGVEDANVGEDLLSDCCQYEVYEDEFELVCKSCGASKKKIRQSIATPIQEIGREKLDFALAWHAEQLTRDPNLKLLTWCRFVHELRRYLYSVRGKFGHPIGAACGARIFLDEMANQKTERETALRLLHPKTAPIGPATVGATQGTGALGLNFTACHTVLDMSYDFSPWKKKQGDARVNRPGQTRPVSFFYLIAVGPDQQRTIDHHIMMVRLGKTNLNDMTTSAWVRALTEE